MTIRVVLADDQALIRSGFGVLIDSADDLEVVGEAATGDDAVRLARSTRADVVLMDIRMPGRDGISVLQEIGGPPPPVVMMTAYAVEDQLRAAVDAQSFAVVHKPVPPAYLLDLVARAAAA